MKKTLIKNGTLVTASDTFQADLLIVDGTIAAVGQSLSADGAEVVDAGGLYVLPGGIDVDGHSIAFPGTEPYDLGHALFHSDAGSGFACASCHP